ncbi:PAQR family membrane homeostasis protein TrhA [Ilyobacter polytropus]|uniref:Channel protein, hemolysin III family n=1 Tax=Ilyobacter polytropus (strain ATCC 51220 / DSM 2926 / LMG 16218 / CuHBu1) TaxID=572544 RepID=E3H7S9_ILYPC|nr:hemolysin III family protein [Ilyobacter polytropus]ADO82661.1 channel protein, hemolysin III family [Ilyobacter polytropus DSM 2926]
MTDHNKLEEYMNSITHYLGALTAVYGLVLLIFRALNFGTIAHLISFSIFGAALVLLYSMSGTYHILQPGKAKKLFKIFDHSAIYILISSSYTPYLLTVVKGQVAIVLLVIQWMLTLMGIIFKIKFTGRFTFVSTLIYLFMGWMIIFVFKNLKANLNSEALNFLLASGITYSVGAIFYLLKKIKFTHVIWHLFVIGGSVLNYLSIYYSI